MLNVSIICNTKNTKPLLSKDQSKIFNDVFNPFDINFKLHRIYNPGDPILDAQPALIKIVETRMIRNEYDVIRDIDVLLINRIPTLWMSRNDKQL